MNEFKDVLPAPPTRVARVPAQRHARHLQPRSTTTSVTTPHRVEITASVLADDGKTVFTTSDERNSEELQGASGGYGYTTKIPLPGFAPGRYVLRLEAKSLLGNAGAGQARGRVPGAMIDLRRSRAATPAASSSRAASIARDRGGVAHAVGDARRPGHRAAAGGLRRPDRGRGGVRRRAPDGRLRRGHRRRARVARRRATPRHRTRAGAGNTDRSDPHIPLPHRHDAAAGLETSFGICTRPLDPDRRLQISGYRIPQTDTATGPAYRIPETATSTGLRPRTASVLAYLAGPLSGAVLLVAESANDDVRFHAWQSVIALGALAIAVGLGYLMALASLFVSTPPRCPSSSASLRSCGSCCSSCGRSACGRRTAAAAGSCHSPANGRSG